MGITLNQKKMCAAWQKCHILIDFLIYVIKIAKNSIIINF